MPDHERHAEEIERTLATVSNDYLLPDYGTALLDTSAAQHGLSAGRKKMKGGIIFPSNYRFPIVNIRAPKWLDALFWIRAEDFEAAQFIADAVYYFIGRGPFHFRDVHFRYPPLCLGTGELLTTMEKCSAHVAKIAKGPALRNERMYYKDRVQKLVLEMVKSPEVVQFLDSVRANLRPCLVDGGHVDNIIIPGYDPEGWDYDNATMKILAEGLKGHSSGGDEQSSKADVISRDMFHSHCLEFLVKNGPDFLMENLQGQESIGSLLFKMAENVTVLTPANDPLPWDILNMSLWKASLCELIKEMKTVEEKCPSLICNPGVYVLTSSPYAAFLTALAAEMPSDAAEKINLFDNL